MSDNEYDVAGPGWFPDPDGGPGDRWWDGRRWTRRYNPPRSMATWKIVALIVVIAWFFAAFAYHRATHDNSGTAFRGVVRVQSDPGACSTGTSQECLDAYGQMVVP